MRSWALNCTQAECKFPVWPPRRVPNFWDVKELVPPRQRLPPHVYALFSHINPLLLLQRGLEALLAQFKHLLPLPLQAVVLQIKETRAVPARRENLPREQRLVGGVKRPVDGEQGEPVGFGGAW